MKKIIFSLIMILGTAQYSWTCGPVWEPELQYYNLFMQEIIDDPQYYPFLVTLDSEYYTSSKSVVPNENIEEWQQYLKISYNDANYLVFKTAKAEIDSLITGKQITNQNLRFADPVFIKKYKQALLYLSYAKYLEPYMSITRSNTDWHYREDEGTADIPDYQKVISVLQKSWKAEQDKELKLRYGYQLVRFAHYNRNYQDAMGYFNTYVEPLNYKPAMYYHALCQKAGAEKGLGNEIDARSNFFRVFVHSKNLKTVALTSMKFENYNNMDFNEFLENTQTEKEKNDAYLLLGFNSFNNPINEAEKIITTSPDAIQAKVLIARAINFLERKIMPIDYYFNWYFYTDDAQSPKIKDPRYPIISGRKTIDFFDKTRNLVIQTAQNKNVKDKNFWNITAAYLCFLNKEYVEAKKYLDKVGISDIKYALQKKSLAMYIDVSEHPQITKELETGIYNKYKDILENATFTDSYSESFSLPDYNTQNFVIDVLANRYFLQKDYAKSFLLNNNIFALERNPQLSLLESIEAFYNKSGKNGFESFIEKRMLYGINPGAAGILSTLNYIRGYIYLSKADFNKAYTAFEKVRPADLGNYTRSIFGYNRIECFNCQPEMVMNETDMQDFPYIPSVMNEKELADILIRLQKTGQQSNESAAKANYLLGNFFYNTSNTGYYRTNLRFGYYREAYFKEINIYDNIYFKYYGYYYDNLTPVSEKYLEKALGMAKNNELRAKIIFALSKCEQENYYYDYADSFNGNGILISDRYYFKELIQYKNTKFFDEVQTYCKYFDYYVRYCMK